MQRMVRRPAWAAFVALLALPGACGGGGDLTGPGPDRLGVLFVGNSLTYTHDLPGMLERLLVVGGVEGPVVEAEARPNFGLPDHWTDGRARERIAAGGWTVVVLQQGPSATEGRPYLLEYAPRFADEIRGAGARPALYMVWPARSRPFDFAGVLDSYRTAAEAVDGLFFPAGEAWRIAWERDPDLALYGPDGFHPSLLGTYLAALVMYEQLAGRDPTGLPASIPTSTGDVALEPDVARLLQEAAREANARHARRDVASPGPPEVETRSGDGYRRIDGGRARRSASRGPGVAWTVAGLTGQGEAWHGRERTVVGAGRSR